jgi:alpha-glucosidase (family GH31 glycosyl hydrolase)
VPLRRGDWIEAWSGERVAGGRVLEAPAPLDAIPVWVRAGAIVVTLPAAHVASGLGDTPETARPLVATLWGEPRGGRALTRLAASSRTV